MFVCGFSGPVAPFRCTLHLTVTARIQHKAKHALSSSHICRIYAHPSPPSAALLQRLKMSCLANHRCHSQLHTRYRRLLLSANHVCSVRVFLTTIRVVCVLFYANMHVPLTAEGQAALISQPALLRCLPQLLDLRLSDTVLSNTALVIGQACHRGVCHKSVMPLLLCCLMSCGAWLLTLLSYSRSDAGVMCV